MPTYRTPLAVALVAACLAAPAAVRAGDEPLAAILASGALADPANPVLLDVLQVEGEVALAEAHREQAMGQLVAALEEDTLVSPLEMLDLPAMFRMTLGSGLKEAVRPENLLRSALGQPARPRPGQQQQAQRQIEEMLTDPWVRGLAAARALARAGRGSSTHAFYRGCLQWSLTVDWLRDRCAGEAVASLGREHAAALFLAMLENPYLDLGIDFRALGVEPPRQQPVPQVEAAALVGVGRLLASDEYSGGARRALLDRALRVASEGREQPQVQAALVEALAAARDPRAVEPLRRFAHGGKASRRGAPVTAEVQAEAWRALALAYGDADAVQRLERQLRRGEPEERFAAGRTLLLAGRDSGHRWAEEYLARQTIPIQEPDFRPSVVRALAQAGQPRGRALLQGVLGRGHHSDWLEAWIAAALVELGDAGRIAALGPALDQEHWDLGRRTAGMWLRMLRPLMWEAARTAAGIPSDRAGQLVLDFAFGARDRAIQHAAEQQRRTAQLRWQIADSLGELDHPAAVPLLARLLEDGSDSVRLTAIAALLRQTDVAAAPVKARALELDYGEQAGRSRNPEVRAALLRDLLLHHRGEAATATVLAAPQRLPDSSVRFLALAAAAH
ncbi:MAG TPA: HEAT repeat domain-containing protein [Thermoanaerobaculia bacterium]|nr:HEAT repeat domain-containing protein [Thermoanaerobaculia bacterium]